MEKMIQHKIYSFSEVTMAVGVFIFLIFIVQPIMGGAI